MASAMPQRERPMQPTAKPMQKMPGRKPCNDPTLREPNIISYYVFHPMLHNAYIHEMAVAGPHHTFVGYRNRVVYCYRDPGTSDSTSENYIYAYGPIEESVYE